MADFCEVMRQYKRMCKTQKQNQRGCEMCNLTASPIPDCKERMIVEPKSFEETVMLWATEHPEPVYPTWGTWLAKEFGYDLREIMYEPIKAKYAELLGIEPNEPT